MHILAKFYVVEMPNGEQWSIPVNVIAMDRARHYAKEFGGDVDRSLIEDTVPLFESDDYEIEDWAKNNMNWSGVEDSATMISRSACDYQEGWVNGKARITE